ncbi:MAG: DUF1788 domain-containing protein [Anaerolineaceae bacterium]|nr:DUF1788 domain-containing protein [Anaerolineaceae bacterium]
MLSLKDRIELLENDLKADPPRISVYHDLPFAILRYEPQEEWVIRKEARLLATRLKAAGKQIVFISLAKLLWDAIENAEGLEAIVDLERRQGFERAQRQVTTYFSDPNWYLLPDILAIEMNKHDARKTIVFLTRAASFSPAIYHLSKLLDEMQGRTKVPAILFYPGSLEGTTGLRFMALKDRESFGNYRVKIYG